MKRFYGFIFLSLVAILASLTYPVSAAQQGTVVASAVVVPAQISRLSFLTPGLVKEVAVGKGDDVRSGQLLAALNTPELEYIVLASQEAFRSKQAYAELQRYKRVQERRNGRVFWNVVPPEVRQKVDAEAARAQAALEAAQATLAQSTLLAPYDGTVAAVEILPGEYAEPGQVIITLATLDALQLETTDLSERDVPRVRIGAPVDIFVEALNESFTGRVINISPKADTVGGDVVFKVIIAFDQQPKNLFWGMTAEVNIGE